MRDAVEKPLPEPPRPRGLAWIGVVGPGVIVLGAALGSGEFLLGPAAFVRHGLTLLWVTTAAALLQTVFNTEVMRWTLATGEPVITGFLRAPAGRAFPAALYGLLILLQIGWPAWAGTAAGAFFYLGAGSVPGPADVGAVRAIGVSAFAVCVAILVFGRRIERTLEVLNWILVVAILGGFLVMAAFLVGPGTWWRAAAGFLAWDPGAGRFAFLPAGVDPFLLGALAGYSGLGGVGNLMLSNWARDKGYGMAAHAGYIASAIGGRRSDVSAAGFTFVPDAAAMTRWRGWWRIVAVDQWGIYFTGALLGMGLPALLYVTFVPAGSEIRGLGIAAALAEAMGRAAGPLLGTTIAVMGAWMLFKTQLDLFEGMVRALTDLGWAASGRLRSRCRNDVRVLYYGILAAAAAWGVAALFLAQPVRLLQFSANVAGAVFVVASLHVLWINSRLLPAPLRPPLWRKAALVAMAVFYGWFATQGFSALLAG